MSEKQILQNLLRENQELKDRLDNILKHPDYTSYIADLTQFKFWDSEIFNNPVSVKSGTEEDMRAFDKVLKFMLEKPKLKANLDASRAKLNPVEIEKAEQESTSMIDDVRKLISQEARNEDI